MNAQVEIMINQISRCTYFLSLMKGPNVKGFTQITHQWLDNIEEDNLAPWKELEKNFQKQFIDYAEHERVHDKLKKLYICDGNVNEYMANFADLALQASLDPDDLANLQMFAQGLLPKLTNACINNESPEMFSMWIRAAQRQQKNWIHKQAIAWSHKSRLGPPRQQQNQEQAQGHQFFWNKGGNSNNQGNWGQAPPHCLPQRNPNAIDVDIVWKAMKEAEKEQHCKEGQCYECSKQGHIAHSCPLRKSKVHTTWVEKDKEPKEDKNSVT
jgi:hypothetical protein